MRVIRELVYTIIHEHIQFRKSDLTGLDNLELYFGNESEDTLNRYCGVAPQRMIETLALKQNRIE